MDINKYIENTKRKTKKAKLPALSTLSPVMPDGAAGITTFNNSFGEELDLKDINNVKSAVKTESKNFMLDKGFTEDELDKALHIEFIENENVFTIVITADLTISSLRELADSLYDVVSGFDEDAYFDISANNSISVELTMGTSLTETLHKLDRDGFDKYSKNYEFEALYESTKTKLSNEDRAKLQKFLQTTDDPEEVNVYMKGLLLEEADDEFEDEYSATIDSSVLEEIQNAYNELHDLINHLVGEANRSGNDTLRSSADLALGALDDFSSYLSEIRDDFSDQDLAEKKKSIPSVEKYINDFKEAYPTKEEFESATDLDYIKSDIIDVLYDWIIDDIGDGSSEMEDAAIELAEKAAIKILEG